MVTYDERIVAAAVHYGATISSPPPARHDTILKAIDLIMGIDATKLRPLDQGFLTSAGRFVNRADAYAIAYRSGQVTDTPSYPLLYSEDLW